METALWGALGLCVGSFVNVVIVRLPKGRSIVRPRSQCPRCRRPIAAFDNVPLLSWLLLGGRCRGCRAPIGLRYPLVEALVGAFGAALAWRWPGQPLWTAAALAAGGALAAVAFIDWDTFLIPDVLSLGLLGAGILLSPVNPLLAGQGPARPLWSALGAFSGFALCWAAAALGEAAFKKEAMGGGDVKLLAAVGAWSGALGAFDCLILGSLFGSVYGVALLATGRIRRQEPIPFGPFLSAGAAVNFFYILPFGFPFIT